MSEKKELHQEQLKKVIGGSDDSMYMRRCSDCDFLFDIRTVNYQKQPPQDSSGEGYIGSDMMTYFECPACHHYTPTKSNNSEN